MTRRERLARKADLRETWAAGRAQKAHQEWNAGRHALDGIEPGQPILVGHHSEKKHRKALETHDRHCDHAVEHEDMAAHHASKAEGLRDQLDRSIYSDDHNAVEALEARIAAREAEAARIKQYNASCRAGKIDASLLDDAQQKEVVTLARIGMMKPDGQFPPHALTNLRGNITRDKQRLADIQRRQATTTAAVESETGCIIRGEEYVSITFAEKPDREVLAALKAAGFRWGGGSWNGLREKIPAGVG